MAVRYAYLGPEGTFAEAAAGVGGARQPPVYLQVGNVVKIEIEGIGHIENRVVPEP